MSGKVTYEDAGVSIDRGEELVAKIKAKVKATYNDRVHSGVGGFACLYEVGDKMLAAGTDGVGTKLKLAFERHTHDTVGIDLVAMCVNDILCTGARPLFFMDYLATGSLDLSVSESIINGIVDGCLQSECALIGGETAEMPGMYSEGEYDLAGFAIGEVTAQDILGGDRVKAGMTLIALPAVSFHSNGFSLIRKVEDKLSDHSKDALLKPTKIYWKAVKSLLADKLVAGMSHITGGGLLNIPRMNPNLDYEISLTSDQWQEKFYLKEMHEVQEHAHLDFADMARTFNCGVGLVLAVDNAHEGQVLDHFKSMNEPAFVIGSIKEGRGQVTLSCGLTLQ